MTPARRSPASRRKPPAPRRSAPERFDRGGMGTRIEGLARQLRAGAVLADPLLEALAPNPPRRLVLFGMGGSAIAGELLASLIDREGTTSMQVVRHYEAPGWLTAEDLVIFSSYSGETEETLAAYRSLRALGASRAVLTTGGTLASLAGEDGVPIALLPPGHPPRAALGYSFSALAHLAEHVGVLAGGGRRVLAAAADVERVASACARDVLVSRNPANALAIRLSGHAALLMANSRTLLPAAVRWKGQFNENAKHVAWVSGLPEANHNEVDGFVHPRPVMGRLAAVFLRDPDDNPRIVRRFDWLGRYLRRKGIRVETVTTEGVDRMGRLLSCVALGDFVSYYLALRHATDPTALPGVESLKRTLGR